LPNDDVGWVFEKYVNMDKTFVSEITVNKDGYGMYQLRDVRSRKKSDLLPGHSLFRPY